MTGVEQPGGRVEIDLVVYDFELRGEDRGALFWGDDPGFRGCGGGHGLSLMSPAAAGDGEILSMLNYKIKHAINCGLGSAG